MIAKSLYELTKKSYRKLKIRVDLLDFSFNKIASLEGNTVSGSISIDANADIRRTADVTLVVTDSSFDIGEDKKIWLNKYVQIYVGLFNTSNEVEWINMGMYLIDNPTRTYNATTHTLAFQAYDLMSKMTGLRNGQIPGAPTLIPSGSSIRGAMASTVSQLGGFNNFIIEDNSQEVPYDINIETGGYVADIINELRDISSNWETFFDVNGVFHYQPINAYYSDEIAADDDVFNYVVTDISQEVDFENVKNSIEVWGKSLSPKKYGDVATLSGSTYSITLSDFTALTPNMTIGFTTPANNGTVQNAQISINGGTAIPLVNEDGTGVTISESSTYFVLMSKPKLLDNSSSSTTSTYSANVTFDGNTYVLSIPTLTTWTENATIDMVVPSMKVILNDTTEYTISGTDVAIPNAGSSVYLQVTGSNTMQIVGATTVNYDIDTVSASGLNFYLNVVDTNTLQTGDVIRFTSPYIEKSPSVQINSNSACSLYDSTGATKSALIQTANTTYKIKIAAASNILFLGHQQIYGKLEDTNPESPYFVGKDTGRIYLVLKDGEYDNIYTDQLALERAQYELYLHCRMEDTISLTMVPIYWLDVNQKIYFNEAGINSAYITKTIQVDLSPTGTMQVTAIKFYPDMA